MNIHKNILHTKYIHLLMYILIVSCGKLQNSNDKYFEIDGIKITIRPISINQRALQAIALDHNFLSKPRSSSNSSTTRTSKPSTNSSSNKESEINIANIVNTGKNSWPIITDNKPTINVNIDYANAIPSGIKDSMELENFSDATFNSYEIIADNVYGLKIIQIQYTTIHQYGGSYESKGKYLSSISVIPSMISISWGIKVNFVVNKVSVTNVGTKDNPIASAILNLAIHISTLFKDVRFNIAIQFRGDNALVNMSPL